MVSLSFSFALGALLLQHLASPVRADFGPMKFQHWFYQWEVNALGPNRKILMDEDKCATEVNNYWNKNDTVKWAYPGALDCILSHTSPSMQQSLSTAIVILGLTPTLLSALGPNIAESSMLSLERPLLSLLLSLGAPTVAVSRILTYNDPFSAIQASPNNSKLVPSSALGRRGLFRRLVVAAEYVAAEYVAALGAIANIIQTSLDLGFRAVCSFHCDGQFYPLMWVLLPAFIHIVGVAAFYLTPKAVGEEDEAGAGAGSRQGVRTIYTVAPTRSTIFVQSVASGLAVGHVFLGTIVFSSMLFLMVSDAVPVIMRYAASAVVCRLINQYELACMDEKYRVERVESLGSKGRRILFFMPQLTLSKARRRAK